MPISDVIPFGEWLPDQAPFMNAGVIVAMNVLATGQNYKPFKTLVPNTDALPAACKGAYSFVTEAGTVETFAATATGLYRASGTTWTDVSKIGGYATDEEIYWKFVNYGDRVLATNYTNTIQTFTIGSSTAFADLAGTGHPPKTKFFTVLNNFIMALNVVHFDDNVRGARLQWSGIDDPTYWSDSTTDDATDIEVQSDFQDVYGDYGLGSGIVNLKDYAVAVFERGIVRVSYVGAPLFFTIEGIETKKGSRVPRSVISSGQAVYFLAEDGFYAFDGASTYPIGDQKVDRTFYADVNPNKMHKVQATVDPKNKLVAWLYQSNDSINDAPDKLLIYSWAYQRWTLALVSAEVMLEGLTQSITLEGVGALYPNLDTVPFSLDSRRWAGGNNLLSAFTTDHKLGVFEGINTQATIETTESRFNADGYALITAVLPVVDTVNCTVSIGHRKRISDDPTYSGAVNSNDETGECDVFIEDRYIRAQVIVPAGEDWSNAQGVRFRVENGSDI